MGNQEKHGSSWKCNKTIHKSHYELTLPQLFKHNPCKTPSQGTIISPNFQEMKASHRFCCHEPHLQNTCKTGREKKKTYLLLLSIVADLEILAMQSHLPSVDSPSEVTDIYQYIGPAETSFCQRAVLMNRRKFLVWCFRIKRASEMSSMTRKGSHGYVLQWQKG